MSKFSQILLAIILLLGGVVFFQYKHSVRLSDERDRYKQNNTALLSDIERIKVDSTTMAVDAKALRLTIDEYERFRAADAEKIRQMGVKIKDLQAAAKHQLEVAAPINAVIRDTVFIRDTVPVIQQKVEMVSPHIQLDAVIDNDSLKGDISQGLKQSSADASSAESSAQIVCHAVSNTCFACSKFSRCKTADASRGMALSFEPPSSLTIRKSTSRMASESNRPMSLLALALPCLIFSPE